MAFNPNHYGGPPGSFDGEGAFYGRDLFFDGDLRVASDGDWTTVDGVENLRRAILRRLLVRPGEYRLRPDYGVGLATYAKKSLTSSVKSELVKRITGQLKRDHRIEKVIEVTVSEELSPNSTGFVKVVVIAQALGKRVSFQPFLVPQEI